MDGIAQGLHGIFYEIRMLIYLSVMASLKGWRKFKLRFQVEEMHPFDDILFDKDGNQRYVLFQLKHKKNDSFQLTSNLIFSTTPGGEFNLLKYVKSLIDKNQVTVAFLFTNSRISLKNNEMELNKSDPQRRCYGNKSSITLTNVCPTNNQFLEILDFSTFPQVFSSNRVPKSYKFVGPEILDILKIQGNGILDNNISDKQLEKALGRIIYAVEQPCITKLKAITKEHLKNHFELNNVDDIYASLADLMGEWCLNKQHMFECQVDENIIDFTVIKNFLQQYIKEILFEIYPPTKSFVGRETELEEIKRVFENHQSLLITGLSGVGKTQLVKKFVKQNQSYFFKRVIWINALDNKSVENSLKRLSKNLGLEPSTDITELHKDIVDYFDGLKVLFVLDNVNENGEGNFLLFKQYSLG